MNNWKELLGKRISCNIHSTKIVEAFVTFEDGKYYVCHNNDKQQGESCENRQGYKYSWTLGHKEEYDHNFSEVKILEEVNNSYELY